MRIVSWNAYGADETTLESLAQQLPKEQIDLCVLQETHKTDDSWYDPLRRIPGYGLVPALAENESHTLPTGTLYPADNRETAYALSYKTATVSLRGAPFLLDYTKDGYWGPKTPCDPFQAAAQGYNQRPPLVIPLTYNRKAVTAFNWHAPLKSANARALDMLSLSQTLAQARKGAAILAGDFNNESVKAVFTGFAGLQQKNSKIDYILANTELDKVNEIPGLNVYFGSHWAVAAVVSW